MTADTVYVPTSGVPSAPALALARKGGYRRQAKVYVPSPGVPSAPALALARKGGYRRQAKVYKLRFEDEEFAGLEVRVKSLPVGSFLDLTDLADVAAGAVGPEQKARIEQLFVYFADALLSWNLEEEDGTPVPATLDGVKAQDLDFDLAVIKAWMEAVAGVAAPLGPTLNGGSTTLEASLPMAPLSASPESWTTPS